MIRRGVLKIIRVGAIALAVIVLVFAYIDLETPASAFKDYGDAVKNGAVGPDKWLPSWLPKSARDIHEVHNIDSNVVWLEFKSMSSLQNLGKECQIMDRHGAQAALPDLSAGFPRSIRKSQELLSKAQAIDAVQCKDSDVDRKWIAMRQIGADVVYAWTLFEP